MNIENEDVQNRRGNGIIPPCAGVTPNALPEVQTPLEEENSQTGVSTRNAPPKTIKRKPKPELIPHWYAIRCTYGRETDKEYTSPWLQIETAIARSKNKPCLIVHTPEIVKDGMFDEMILKSDNHIYPIEYDEPFPLHKHIIEDWYREVEKS